MQFKYSKTENGYKLEEDYKFRTNILPQLPRTLENVRLDLDGTLTLKKGFEWDGATGAIDKIKHLLGLKVRNSILRASCVHDGLCNLIAANKLNIIHRRKVDMIFKYICEQDGMSWMRKQWTYYAIRGFVKLKYGLKY